jgi:hypothetical protein
MKRASSSKDQKLLEILKEMESLRAQYPEELLSARRAAFLEQVDQSTVASTEEQPSLQDRQVVDHLRNLGSVPAVYPPRLLAARRSTFTRRIAWLNFVSLCTAAWLAVQKRISVPASPWRMPALRALPTSLLAASMALAVFAGYVFYENQKTIPSSLHLQNGTVHSGRIMTADAREVRITCKPGAQQPLCLAGEYKKEDGLAYQGNGLARPAVAKDTMPDGGDFHKAAYINDGLYGPGASWISNSRNSWIKIDLGKATKVNTVTFGRDRLGKLKGHNPGQFVVSLAVSDNVYANGNSSNDNKEYQQVYNSKQDGFSGRISGAETVVAQFAPMEARYIKITFENKGTAVDEVEAFMAQPPVASSQPDSPSRGKPDKDPSGSVSASAISPLVTVTSPPVPTATPVSTDTQVPNDTVTPIPTATEVPTNTPVPTSTVVPTSTSIPPNTPTPNPSDTPLPPPTSIAAPQDTSTPAPVEPTTQASYFDFLTSIPPGP